MVRTSRPVVFVARDVHASPLKPIEHHAPCSFCVSFSVTVLPYHLNISEREELHKTRMRNPKIANVVT
jgi:hypothetical protein